MPGDFDFKDLTPEVRSYILEEIDLDIADDVLVLSKLFNEQGSAKYPALIREAAAKFDEVWLAQQLLGSFVSQDQKGKAVRGDQHKFFSQCEFNRFYIRGICRYALANPGVAVVVYRARESSSTRAESLAKIGMTLDANLVLEDLRARLGVAVASGMPEINSGLSLMLVRDGHAV